MKLQLLLRLLICIAGLGICLYSCIDKQNELTEWRIRLPALTKEIKRLSEENTRLQYDIDRFESPEHLIALSREKRFNHLRQPLLSEILTCQEGLAVGLPEERHPSALSQTQPTLAVAP